MKWIVGLVIAAAVAWWGFAEFSSTSSAKGKDKVPTVKVTLAPVVRQSVPLSVQLPANVIAYETVAVKSRIDSQIIDVKFHDGDAVQAGQALFVLDDRSLKAQIKQLQASVQKEKAQLENARLQYERAKVLVENKAISKAQYDAAKATYESQLAMVGETQASLDNTAVLLSYSTITAPITGRAGTINVTKGNNVKANDTQALVTINQVSPIRIQFAIPERYYAQVKTAMASAVPVRAAGTQGAEQAEGTLEYIDNTIDPTTGAFTARAKFANEKETLWPGMFVNATLELGSDENVLTVPAVAVQGDTGNNFVFKAVDNKAVKTPVEIARSKGDVTIIAKGLAEGDNVLVDGLMRVTDGATIDSAPAKDAAKDVDKPKS